MTVLSYNIFLLFFKAGIHIASLFNAKAKKWVQGRKDIFKKLKAAIPPGEQIIWMHCASLGEFEQGRPVLERIKVEYPAYKILLTFFSPSGYEAQKNYKEADWVFYLPVDGPRNAKRFLEITHPSLAIFVKYEFWYYYLKKLKYRRVPLLLISALFRKDMSFFQWYGKLQRKMLARFDHLFVQTSESKKLVDEIGLAEICSVSGDTRFDRVIEIAKNFTPVPLIEDFIGHNKAIVAGSTWPEDEEILQKALKVIDDNSLKLIIAPHEINEQHLKGIKQLFPNAVLFSELPAHDLPTGQAGSRLTTILIIDNIGMLSRLYKYGYIAYVGGGMNTGLHNVLEAAVFYKPVLFGPRYEKHAEAVELVKCGGGLPFTEDKKDGLILNELIQILLKDEKKCRYIGKAAGDFVESNKGATQKIMQFIQEKRLLTN